MYPSGSASQLQLGISTSNPPCLQKFLATSLLHAASTVIAWIVFVLQWVHIDSFNMLDFVTEIACRVPPPSLIGHSHTFLLLDTVIMDKSRQLRVLAVQRGSVERTKRTILESRRVRNVHILVCAWVTGPYKRFECTVKVSLFPLSLFLNDWLNPV